LATGWFAAPVLKKLLGPIETSWLDIKFDTSFDALPAASLEPNIEQIRFDFITPSDREIARIEEA
jgi:hypothetical protein